MRHRLQLFFLALVSLAIHHSAKASHMVGSDISYKCTETPGKFEITLILYRYCDGMPLCNGGCGSACTKQVDLFYGSLPSGIEISMGSANLLLQNVRDVNINPNCPNAKSTCTNMGCITPGSYTPGVERYEFKGFINIGTGSGIPASACFVRIAYSECCRNNDITTTPGGSFYIDAVINRCQSVPLSGYPGTCNSSPELTNDPYVVTCGGSSYIFNNGIFDPDHDSLSFAFAPALDKYKQNISYNPPFTYDKPMPWTGKSTDPAPYGIHCDSLSGDIAFTPGNASGQVFTGILAIEIKQWRSVNGIPTLMGITRRDLQILLLANCPPNTPPTFITTPAYPFNSDTAQYNWEVCAGEQLCFQVKARDTDSAPAADTTYIEWNKTLVQYGATFLPNYASANRNKPAPAGGPREDDYTFCWTPDSSKVSSLPYYFTVTAKDNHCPNPGKITRNFSIRVLDQVNGNIKKTDLKCGKWQCSYTQTLSPSTSTLWKIARQPFDDTFTNGADSFNQQTPPALTFKTPGKYLIELSIRNICTNLIIRDTITVESPLTMTVKDTFTCTGNSVTITTIPVNGTPPYSYYWYNSIKDQSTALNSPAFSAPDFSVTPAASGMYAIKIKDASGCEAWDSLKVKVTPAVKSFIITHVSCFNDANGTITINTVDTMPGYQYKLDSRPPQASNSFTNLSPGTYSFAVIDTATNCVYSRNGISITQPAASLNTSVTKTDISNCFNAATGSISVSASGGTAPYAYRLNNGSFSSLKTYSNLAAGTYIITTRDAKLCYKTDTVTLTNLVTEIAVFATYKPLCTLSDKSSIFVTASGGTPPYLYRLNAGTFSSNNNFTNLSANLYQFTVQDSKLCQKTTSVLLLPPAQALTSDLTKEDVSCFGSSDGRVSIITSGGKPPYEYKLNNGNFQNSASFNNLSPGLQLISVRDSNQCIKTEPAITIAQPDKLILSVQSITPASCNGLNDGSLTLTSTGGTGPYTYQINSGNFQLQPTFSGLTAGIVQITVKDSNACTTTISDTVSRAAPAPAGNISGPANVNQGSIEHYTLPLQTGLNYAWNVNNGSILSGQTTDSIVVQWDLAPGTGAVNAYVYSETDCGDSAMVSVTILSTGFEELARQMSLEVYPNPAKNILIIKVNKNFAKGKIRLYDAAGKLVLEQDFKEEQTIALEHIAAGIYLLKAGNWSGKVIKE